MSIGTITSADIIGDIDVPVSASRRLRRNTVIPRVRLESHGWEVVPLDAIAIPQYVAVDGGSRPKEIDFPLVQQVDQGAQLGLYDILNARELDGIVLPAKVYAIGYRPGDCLTIDIPEASLVARDVIVHGREIDGSSMGVTLTCRSETQSKHPFCLGKTGVAPPTPDLSVPPSFGIDPARAAYLIVRQTVEYPVSSTATTIGIAAFDAVIDDGSTIRFPAQTITGLVASSVYIVLWDIAAGQFVAVAAPALAQVASSAYVIVREMTTQNADGTYPSTPTPPGGDGGGGYGGGACPVPEALVLLANADLSGPGGVTTMGELRAGMWVWSPHEHTGEWAAWPVKRVWRFYSKLFEQAGRPATSPSHLWAVDPTDPRAGWHRMDMVGAPAGEGDVIAVTITDAHKQIRRIWAAKSIDHPTDPVSIYRFVILLAGCAVATRGGAEAVSLWSWSSGDARTIERVAEFKRWLDPVSVGCGFLWMTLHVLAEPMLEFQLRKAPLPVDMWSRWPQLRRPVYILIVSLLMAAAAVGLR